MPGALSSPSSPSAEPLSGLAIGLGFLATAIVLLFLPRLLRLNAPWPTASRVSAWVLLTIGVAGTGTELEKLRPGFANLGVGLLLLSVAAGMLALATRVLHGRIAAAAGIVGVLVGLLGMGGAIGGLGELITAGNGRAYSTPPAPTAPGSAWSAAVVIGVVLSGLQLGVAVVALFHDFQR
jgi:hypothetical protein